MEKLPEDVLTSIIFRLPAKRIAQMRSLSKPWNAFLSRPSFIKSHLRYSTHNVDEILLVLNRSVFNQSFTAHPSQSPHLDHVNLINLPVKSQTWHHTIPIAFIGSVNGLICFSTHEREKVHDIYIWNPSLSALIDLPPYISSRGRYAIFRFGFDPKTDDYKVIKIEFRFGGDKTPFGISIAFKDYLQVEVYSMRKGSWEFITQRFPSHVKIIHNTYEVFADRIDGHLHWLCDVGEDHRQQTILAFDLGAESFSQLSPPDFMLEKNAHRVDTLGVLDGKLCVMSSTGDGHELEVWVMDKYGVSESWMKRHVFSLQCGIIYPFGFTLKNEFLFKAFDQNLYLFDPNSDKVKSFMIKARNFVKTKIVQYVESLVWVVPDKCGINMSTLQIEKKD